MSEIIYQTNPTEFYGLDKIKEASEYGFKIRNKNALILSQNIHDNKPRFRFKIDRNSQYYPDKIIDVSIVFGIIDTIKLANKYNNQLTVDYILKQIDEFKLNFHHNNGNTLINEDNTILVNNIQHRKLDNALYFKKDTILYSFSLVGGN